MLRRRAHVVERRTAVGARRAAGKRKAPRGLRGSLPARLVSGRALPAEPPERLSSNWERFARYVKEEARYLFLRTGRSRAAYPDPDEIEPAAMLEALRVSIVNSGVIRPLPAGSQLFRARQHRLEVTLTTPGRAGEPTPGHAGANRMSPAGIPMFYGAEDLQAQLASVTQDLPRRVTSITLLTCDGPRASRTGLPRKFRGSPTQQRPSVTKDLLRGDLVSQRSQQKNSSSVPGARPSSRAWARATTRPAPMPAPWSAALRAWVRSPVPSASIRAIPSSARAA